MKYLLALAWIASLGLAYFLGSNLNSKTNSTHIQMKETSFQDSNDANTNTINQYVLDSIEEVNDSHEYTTGRKSVYEIVNELKLLTSDKTMIFDIGAITESYNLIKNFTEQEIIEALELINAKNFQNGNTAIIVTLLRKFSSLNPEAAMNYVENNIDEPNSRKTAINIALSGWAKSDPYAAYNWYKTNQESELSLTNPFSYSVALQSIFQSLATQNRYDAIDKLAEIDSDRFGLGMAMKGILRTVDNKDDYIEFIDLTSNLESNSGNKRAVITQWSSKEPNEVADWLATQEDSKDTIIMRNALLTNWLNNNPEEAAQWYLDSSIESDKQRPVDSILRVWSRSNPQKALAWLHQQTGINLEQSTKMLIQSSIYMNPQFAKNNLELLSNDQDKVSISTSIYKTLKRNNTKQAAKFLENSKYKNEISLALNEQKKRVIRKTCP